MSEGRRGDTPRWVVRVTARSGVSSEDNLRVPPRSQDRRIIVTMRRYDLGDRTWYPHHPPLFQTCKRARLVKVSQQGKNKIKSRLVSRRRTKNVNKTCRPVVRQRTRASSGKFTTLPQPLLDNLLDTLYNAHMKA